MTTPITSFRNRRLFQSVYLGALFLTAVVSGFSLWYGKRLFIYPAITAFLATLVSSIFLPRMGHDSLNSNRQALLSRDSEFIDDRALMILLFVTIVLLQLVYSQAGFNDAYYTLLIAFTGIFSFLVLRGRWVLPLFGLILLAVLFRGHIWFSAPIYSKDPRLHTAIVGYMIERNELIPHEISYYWAYPIADIYAKIVALVLTTSAKRAYFYAITVPAVLAAFVAFPAVRRVLRYRDDSMAVAAIALVLFSAFHLVESSGPKPQTLSTFYLSVILLLLVADIRYRRVLVGLFFFVLIKTHLLAPLIAVGLVGSYFLVAFIYPILDPDTEYEFKARQPYFVALALFVATLQQYYFVGHFRIQVLRFLSTFQPSRGGVGEFVSQAGELTTTDVPIKLDPLLLQAGTLLIIGFLVIVVGFLFLGNLLFVRDDTVEWTWVLTGAIMFAFFSAGFFGSAVIRRGAAAVSVLTVPLVAFVLVKFGHRSSSGTRLVFILLLISGTYLGVAHQGVLLSERDNGFRPTLDESEVHSMKFVRGMNQQPYSFSYYSTSAFLQTVGEGQPRPVTNGFGHHSTANPDSLERFCNEHPDSPFVYRTYYEKYSGTQLPANSDVVYSTADIRIMAGCKQKSEK